jgi:hypothetical protein
MIFQLVLQFELFYTLAHEKQGLIAFTRGVQDRNGVLDLFPFWRYIMKSVKIVFALVLFIFAAFIVYSIPASADTDPTLAKVLIGNWQYLYGGKVMGTIRFDGLTAGTIYDNRYGTGSFSGKFSASNVFEGRAMLPKANTNSQINLVIDFYHPVNNPTVWSFNGWVSDYTNGSFNQGQKL